MTVSDYIFNFLTLKGVDTVFMITGGQAMFLNDAVYRNKKINYICNHHEQALGMSAAAYGRATGKLGVGLVTAGPAAINVLNGVVGGWVDSSPMMIISGQSALSYVQYQQKTKIRQYGIQGINIKPIVEKITKYFVTVDDPSLIQYYMQKAYYLALNGRPGPVWIEVPLDIQRMEVPKKLLKEFIPEDKNEVSGELTNNVKKALELLSKSKYPILFVGQGIRLARAMEEFKKTVKKLQIPVITSRLGIDVINSDNELYVGRPGTYGERAAHFAIQNSDFILVVGSRLSNSTVCHNPKEFGKNAKKIVVDIDIEELEKPSIDIFLKINTDAKLFLNELLKHINSYKLPSYKNWIKRCNYWKNKYPVVLPEYKKEKPINSYYFTNELSKMADAKDIILIDTGSCFHVACQSWKIKKDQRFLTTGGISTMGYWAAGIGACLANNRKNTIVLTGDGSLQFNIQEFATIKHNNLPIKVFIFNNNGYLLIRHTQKNFMDGRLIGEKPANGVWCPDSLKIASAYEIKGVRISSIDEIEKKVREVLDFKGPVICDVMTPEWQLLMPRMSSEKRPDGTLVSNPYEDLFPLLDRKELARSNRP